MKEILEKTHKLFFIILPFIDILTSLMTRYINFPISIGIIIKGLYTLLITLYIIFYVKNKEKKHFILYSVFLILYIMLFILTKKHIWNLNILLYEFIALYKYMFTGFILFAYILIYKNKKTDGKISKIMFYTLIMYVLLLIIPEFTNTAFNSYTTKPHDGTVGWFFAANEISAIILMLYPFYFSKLQNQIKEKKYFYLLLIIPIIYAIFIIGTKASWYGLILITLAMGIIYIFKERKNKKIIIFLILTIVSLLLLNKYAPTNTNLHKSIDGTTNTKVSIKKDNEDKEIKKQENTNCGKKYSIKEIIPNKNLRKIINVLFSGRENKAYTQLKIYNNSSFVNKLLGLGFSNTKKINNCYIKNYVEIDLIDGLVHFGIIGLIVLLFPYIYLIKSIKIKNIKTINSQNLIYIFTFILLIGLSFASGHILGYPTPSIYLNLLLILILNNINDLEKNRGV